MNYSSPSHPLIHAFLLQGVEFRDSKKIIVETREQGESLLKVLIALQEIKKAERKRQKANLSPNPSPIGEGNGKYAPLIKGGRGDFSHREKMYRLISKPIDILEVTYDSELVGIFPVETLDWTIDDEKKLTLELTKNMQYTEETLIHWLTDHGYTARKSDEENSFFRQGDTVSIQTKKGILLVSFFGSTLETLFLGAEERQEFRLFSVL